MLKIKRLQQIHDILPKLAEVIKVTTEQFKQGRIIYIGLEPVVV